MTSDRKGGKHYVLRRRRQQNHRPEAAPSSGSTDDSSFDLERDLENYDVTYPGGDVYVFYLQTKEGRVVGPLRFDVEDVEMGLPGEIGERDMTGGERKSDEIARNSGARSNNDIGEGYIGALYFFQWLRYRNQLHFPLLC